MGLIAMAFPGLERSPLSDWEKRGNVSLAPGGEKGALVATLDCAKEGYGWWRVKLPKGDRGNVSFQVKGPVGSLGVVLLRRENGKEVKWNAAVDLTGEWQAVSIPLASFLKGKEPLTPDEAATMEFLGFSMAKTSDTMTLAITELGFEGGKTPSAPLSSKVDAADDGGPLPKISVGAILHDFEHETGPWETRVNVKTSRVPLGGDSGFGLKADLDLANGGYGWFRFKAQGRMPDTRAHDCLQFLGRATGAGKLDITLIRMDGGTEKKFTTTIPITARWQLVQIPWNRFKDGGRPIGENDLGDISFITFAMGRENDHAVVFLDDLSAGTWESRRTGKVPPFKVENGDFEQGLTGWSKDLSAAASSEGCEVVADTAGRTGKALRLAAAIQDRFGVTRTIPTDVRGPVRVRAWVRAEGKGTLDPIFPGFIITLKASGREEVEYLIGTGGATRFPSGQFAAGLQGRLPREWTPIDQVVDIPADTEGITLGLYSHRLQGDLLIDDVSLEAVPGGRLSSLIPERAPQIRAEDLPSPSRIREIAAMIKGKPSFGPHRTNRAFWESFAASAQGKKIRDQAEPILGTRCPTITLEDWQGFAKNGSRDSYQKANGEMNKRLYLFLFAELMENKGRFLPGLEETILAHCDLKTWLPNFHVAGDEAYFTTGRPDKPFIELVSGMRAWSLAIARHWLDDRLRPEVQKRLLGELEARIWGPYRRYMKDGNDWAWFWTTSEFNWNPVVNGCVIGSALVSLEKPEDRAFFIGVGDRLLRYYLNGFGEDGYTVEGMMYYGYGTDHFFSAAAAMREATGGGVDLFADPRVAAVVSLPNNLMLPGGCYPAFGDSPGWHGPWSNLILTHSRRFGFGKYPTQEPVGFGQDTPYYGGFSWFGTRPLYDDLPPALRQAGTERTFFPSGGVWVSRLGSVQDPKSQDHLAFTYKASANSGSHHHQDNGTYAVCYRSTMLLLDPGSDKYTRDNFGANRWKSELNNSFGHAVPVVDGQMQVEGRDAVAPILSIETNDARFDRITVDLTRSYRVPHLKKLHRIFTFRRGGTGVLEVEDRFSFSRPSKFATAAITRAEVRLDGTGVKVGSQPALAITPVVTADGVTGGDLVAVQSDEIRGIFGDANPQKGNQRVSFTFKKPVTEGSILLRMEGLP